MHVLCCTQICNKMTSKKLNQSFIVFRQLNQSFIVFRHLISHHSLESKSFNWCTGRKEYPPYNVISLQYLTCCHIEKSNHVYLISATNTNLEIPSMTAIFGPFQKSMPFWNMANMNLLLYKSIRLYSPVDRQKFFISDYLALDSLVYLLHCNYID